MAWNCRGIGRVAAVRSLQVMIQTHKPSILFLSELKTSSLPKIQKIMSSLGFPNLEFVPSIGAAGGLVLGWKNSVQIQVIVSTAWFINVLILSHPQHTP